MQHLSFGERLRELRIRLNVKQLWLAREIGCSDAALSFWERDRRLPSAPLFVRMVDVLRTHGAMAEDVSRLQRSWDERALGSRQRILAGQLSGANSSFGHRPP